MKRGGNMSKKFKLLAVIMTAFIMLEIFAGGLFNSVSITIPTNNYQYRLDLTSIYQNYDENLSSVDENDTFALRRLIVSDYDGNDYGAAQKAIDEKNCFAVLQFETEEQAEYAYNEMIDDGHVVDADGIAKLTSYDVGDMHPIASDALGVKPYVNNFNMEKDDIVVAVIDTAVMLHHDDLEGRFVNDGYDFSYDKFDNADYDKELQPYNHHSTAICSIIANNTTENVKILPYKVMPYGSLSTSDSAIISAINDAVDKGVDVINISAISTASGTSYMRALENAERNNVCVCVSAGNDAKDCSNSYPASIESAFTVSALTAKLSTKASYSNFGSCVDFCAPGTKINCATPLVNGESGYAEYSGTSFSTPYITALCADIKSMNAGLTNDDVHKILCDFSVDYGDVGFDDYYGNGLPNIGNIVYQQQGSYDYFLPQGTLNLYSGDDFEPNTQPWNTFSSKLVCVNIPSNVDSIGAYTFDNMTNASFNIGSSFISVGEYAFRNCQSLDSITFDSNVQYIGEGAFDGVDDLVIGGYMNTPAYDYAVENNVTFNSLGCNHSYVASIIEPNGNTEGYTRYECRVCGDVYFGEYIVSEIINAGQCGDSLRYEVYNTGKLNIIGTGDMYDYSNTQIPWYDYSDIISEVHISQGVGEISPFAFYNCTNLFQFISDSSLYSVINKSLYNEDGTKLICAVVGYGNSYVMPDSVQEFDATAFLTTKTVSVVVNDNFSILSSLVWDNNGNIVMALPSYRSALLSIDSDISLSKYAFILTDYPKNVRVYSTNTEFDEYSIGYHYDCGMVKEDLGYYGYVDAPAYQYAVTNDFETNLLNSGDCGDNLHWYFNVASKNLFITGSGDMTSYSNKMLVPWYDYMQDIEKLVISDDVSGLSAYAFYNATGIKQLTIPASISAPSSANVWFGCSNIETINITIGSGYMADYGTSTSSRVYTYTPWYISRDSIVNFNLTPDVIRVGAFAFRACSCIQSVELNNCSIISKYAFYDCKNLESMTIRYKDTSFGTNCLFKYSTLDNANDNATLYAYCDSTTKDFATKNQFDFVSIGCGHSRGYIAQSDLPSCCYDTNVEYYCNDCNKHLYDEHINAKSNGHFVKAYVVNTKGMVISDADVYIDGKLSAKTNNSGKFIIDNVLCNIDHTVEIKKHDLTIASIVVNTNQSNRSGNVVIKYGNFIKDSAVNGKDYAYAKKNGFNDMYLMDFGKIAGEKLSINTKYQKQTFPFVSNMYVEQNDSVQYRKDFYFDVIRNSDFTVTEIGILYGKNMTPEFMVVENAGKKNSENYTLNKALGAENKATYVLTFGSSSSTGTLYARMYIKYTNGVKQYIYYSDIQSYSY